MVSTDARNLSTDAGRLAHAASDRLARHVRSQRLSGPRPSAFAHVPESTAETADAPPAPASGLDPSELARRAGERFAGHIHARREGAPKADARPPVPSAGEPEKESGNAPGDHAPADRLDIAALAKRATERMTEHVRRQREASGLASRPVAARRPEPKTEPQRPNGAEPSPLLGHNSAGFDMEDEDDRPAPKSGPLDFASLAERAAAIQSAHLAASRKKLTVQSFAVSRQGKDKDSTN